VYLKYITDLKAENNDEIGHYGQTIINNKCFIMPSHKHIQYIIFDLGAVVLNIDFSLTINAFKNIGIKDFDNIFTQARQDEFFDYFESGKLSPEQFRDKLRKLTDINLQDKAIDDAWNAMIIDFDKDNIDLLKKVKLNYFTCLLSNTNAIHEPVYNSLLLPYGINHISELFHKAYLSHKIGMRKPEERIFSYVINDSKLIPQKTLYIDDTDYYLPVAERFGINTLHFSKGMRLTDLFSKEGYLF